MASKSRRDTKENQKDQTERPAAGSSDRKSPEMQAAEYADSLRERAPTTEQSARDAAGVTRRPPDGHPDSYTGVSDTPNAIPPEDRNRPHGWDISHRGNDKIQGEHVETTGDHAERQIEKNHL